MRAGIRLKPTFPAGDELSHSATYSSRECAASYRVLISFRHPQTKRPHRALHIEVSHPCYIPNPELRCAVSTSRAVQFNLKPSLADNARATSHPIRYTDNARYLSSQLAFTSKTIEDAFNFLQSGACNWVFGPGMICRIRNFALLDAGAVPNTNANASVYTSYNLNMYRVLGWRPTPLKLSGNRIRIYFRAQIGDTPAPRSRVSAVRPRYQLP